MTPSTTANPPPADSNRRKSVIRYLAITLFPASVIFVVSVVLALAMSDRMPNEVAVHFDGSFTANGYSSLPVFVTTLAISAFLVAGLLVLGAVNGLAPGWAGRLQGAVTSATLMMLSALIPAILIPQAGLDTASLVVLPRWSLLLILGFTICGLGLGAIAPPVSAQSEHNVSSTDVVLTGNDRAVWFGAGRVNTALSLIVWGALLAVALLTFLINRNTSISVWALIAMLAGALFLVALLYSVHVRVDSHGVHWRYFLGIPRGSISYDALKDVEVAHIRPGEWGGWGWRVGPLGTGLIIRGGEGLRLQRKGKNDLYITVDDARSGAGLIKAFQRRASAEN